MTYYIRWLVNYSRFGAICELESACVVSGWLWSCRVWNTTELVAWGFPWGYSLWWNLHHDIKLKNNCLVAVIFWQILVPSRTMNITHEGTDIIGYYCMCIYIYFVVNKYYYIIIYGGSHASDILHVLMGVSLAKLIIYNIVLLFICHNKRSSSSSSSSSSSTRLCAAIQKPWCGATVCVQRKLLCVHFDVRKSASNVLLYKKDLQMCAYCPDSRHVPYFIIHCQWLKLNVDFRGKAYGGPRPPPP